MPALDLVDSRLNGQMLRVGLPSQADAMAARKRLQPPRTCPKGGRSFLPVDESPFSWRHEEIAPSHAALWLCAACMLQIPLPRRVENGTCRQDGAKDATCLLGLLRFEFSFRPLPTSTPGSCLRQTASPQLARVRHTGLLPFSAAAGGTRRQPAA